MDTVLDDDQRSEFQTNGFLIIRNCISQTKIAELQIEADRLQADDDLMGRKVPEIEPRATIDGSTVYDRLDPVICHSDMFRQLTDHPQIVTPLRSLFGEAPRLLKDKLICKPPGAMGYGLHQDYAYWDYLGVPANSVCSVLVALDDATEENGALQVLSGLHHQRLPPPTSDPRDVDESKVDMARTQLIEMDAGDLLLFHSLSPHFSGPNRSGRSRRSLFLTYNASSSGNVYNQYQTSRHQQAANG